LAKLLANRMRKVIGSVISERLLKIDRFLTEFL